MSELWGKNNPLFMYGNPEKLDDLIGRAIGSVMEQVETAKSKSLQGDLESSFKLGSIFNILGLGEAEAKAAASSKGEQSRSTISKIPMDTKISWLSKYCSEQQFFPYLNVFEGTSLKRDNSMTVSQWSSEPIGDWHKFDAPGQVLGIFSARRIIPAPDGTERIYNDYFSSADALWLFESVSDSNIKTEVPIFLRHTRSNSQHATLALIKSENRFKIEVFGLLTWSSDLLTVDPIAWRLFY